MKRILLLALILTGFISVNKAFAQTASLSITLSDVLSMTVTAPTAVTFDTEAKYTSGVSLPMADHITVISSKGYTVKAISGVITGPSTLTAATVKLSTAIGATNGGNTAGTLTYATDVALPAVGGTAATVISSNQTSWNLLVSANKFNVTYKIGEGGVYAGKTIGANVIPVIYTVTQP
ncbi:hypothetical protein [Pedobacter frigoris]|uniref:DUF4402 domain-containing protein n=1 Tax=Pedobacter frigoris TaxID=2571272 RepID=A0A4U1CMG4_9SPHI|nr:hypothetical protein [Pedobacter frigoris]TKC08634.1 hypothetical protein FA047_00605 [Pedobacter frigoris]